MEKIAISFRGNVIKQFSSRYQLLGYTLDFFIKAIIFCFLVFMGLIPQMILDADTYLSRFVTLYSVALFIWALVLIKYIYFGKKIFKKTQFDLYFMGMLGLSILSILLSEDRITGVFGAFGTYSISILSLLSFAIVYYVIIMMFSYGRGIKWLHLGFVLSTLISGAYFIIQILNGEKWLIDDEYLVYIIISLPLQILSVFLFRKLYTKILAFLALLGSLFLVSYYSEYLHGAMFVLGTGVLALFLLFYFSFWVRSSQKIITFVKSFLKNLTDSKKRKAVLQKNKDGAILFVLMLFIAFWILGLGYAVWQYFHVNIQNPVLEDYKNGFANLDGAKAWILGNADLSRGYSIIEVVNILGNFGLLGFMLVTLFLGYSTYLLSKMTLKMLYSASWRSVILMSGMFVTWICIVVNFLTARLNSIVYVLFILILALYVIIDTLMKRKVGSVLMTKEYTGSTKQLLIKTVVSVLLLLVAGAGMINFLTGADGRLF